MELRHYLTAVRDGKKIVIGVFLVALALGGVLALTQSAAYTSTTKVFVATQVESKNPDELLQRNAIAQQRITSYVEVLRGNVFARQVARETGSAFDIKDVTVSVTPSTSVIDVTVTNASASKAQALAAAYGEAAPATLRDLERSDTGGWQVVATVINKAGKGEPSDARPAAVVVLLAAFLGLGAGVVAAVSWWAVRRELAAHHPVVTS